MGNAERPSLETVPPPQDEELKRPEVGGIEVTPLRIVSLSIIPLMTGIYFGFHRQNQKLQERANNTSPSPSNTPASTKKALENIATATKATPIKPKTPSPSSPPSTQKLQNTPVSPQFQKAGLLTRFTHFATRLGIQAGAEESAASLAVRAIGYGSFLAFTCVGLVTLGVVSIAGTNSSLAQKDSWAQGKEKRI